MNDWIESKTRQRQQGQSVILVAAAMLALLLFAAIAVDMSKAYVDRRVAQNAADGAALAGVQTLGHQINIELFNDAAIMRAMNDYAERNGIADTNGILADLVNANVEGFYLNEKANRIGPVGTGSVPPKAWGIEAVTYITAPTFFGGVFGLNDLALNAEAAALLQKSCGGDCIVPIATSHRLFVTSTEPYSPCFNIWNGTGPGNFGWLNWSLQEGNVPGPIPCDQGDCSDQCLEQNLDPDWCGSGFIEVGDWVNGTVGTITSNGVRQLLKYYIDTPQPFTVIVWDEVATGQGCGASYQVAGFARFQLLGYKLAQGGGVAYDPYVDPSTCVPVGEIPGDDPNAGGRLTAKFLPYTGGQAGKCKAIGTVRSWMLIK